VVIGSPIAKPTGVFVKLDPDQVIADERARLGDSAPGGTRHHTDPLAAPRMGRAKDAVEHAGAAPGGGEATSA
jgi:methionyl-tRNA synthetase